MKSFSRRARRIFVSSLVFIFAVSLIFPIGPARAVDVGINVKVSQDDPAQNAFYGQISNTSTGKLMTLTRVGVGDMFKVDRNGKVYATGGYCDINGNNCASAGQWTTSGSNIYNANAGNVGIGTTDPNIGRLHVTAATGGSVIASFGDTSNAVYPGYIYISDTNTINSGYNVNSNTGFYLNYVGYLNGSSQFRDLYVANGKTGVMTSFIGATGNVGIGNTGPNTKLYVAGDTSVIGGTTNSANDATLYVNADNNNDWGLVVDKYRSSATEYGMEVRVSSGATYGYSLLGSGSRNFTVSGNGNGYFAGNVGIGTTAPATPLHIYGAGGLRLEQDSTSKYGFISSQDNLHITQNVWYNGSRWLTIAAGKSGGFQTYTSGDEALRVFADNTSRAAGTDVSSYLSALMVVKTSGNVGIGTTGPGTKLHVVGPGPVIVENSGEADIQYKDTSTSNQSWEVGTNANGYYIYDDNPGGSGYYAVTVKKSTGNVGIGNTGPGYKLDVSGRINAASDSGNGGYISTGNYGGTGSAAYFPSGLWANGGTNWIYGNTYIGNGSNGLYVTNGGNVGIGNTSPGQKLEVSGNARVRGDLFLDNNYGNSVVGVYDSYRYQGVFSMGDAYKPAADGTSLSNLYGLAWTHSNVGGQSKSGLEHQLLVVNHGETFTALGNGIWTKGNATIGGGVSVGSTLSMNMNSIYFATPGDGAYIYPETYGSGNGSRLVIETRDDGDEDYTVIRNRHWSAGATDPLEVHRGYIYSPANMYVMGNVGIGTSAPTSKLHVIGDIRSSAHTWTYDITADHWAEILGYAGIGTMANPAYTLIVGTSPFVVLPNGNVGIGTSDPAGWKLRVSGNSRFDGTLTMYGNIDASQSGGTAAISGYGSTAIYGSGTSYGGFFTSGNEGIHASGANWAGYFVGNGYFSGDLKVGASSERYVDAGRLYLNNSAWHSWGNSIIDGRVWSANSNIHLSPPAGSSVYINDDYRDAGGSSGGSVGLVVDGSGTFGGSLSVNGNLIFSSSNPYISASSYFIAPGGAYFNSGTVYTEATIQARGGLHNDTGSYLVLYGGTSGWTYAASSFMVSGNCQYYDGGSWRDDDGYGYCKGVAYDVAELISVPKDELIDAGDVIIAGDREEYGEIAKKGYDSRVIGVYSTAAAITFRGENLIMDKRNYENFPADKHNGEIPLALAGRVPVKVSSENGEIKAGDLLTTASLTGHAMKFSLLEPTGEETMKEFLAINKENERRRNSILGKALEDFTADKENSKTDHTGQAAAKGWRTGKIMTLVTLQ